MFLSDHVVCLDFVMCLKCVLDCCSCLLMLFDIVLEVCGNPYNTSAWSYPFESCVFVYLSFFLVSKYAMSLMSCWKVFRSVLGAFRRHYPQLFNIVFSMSYDVAFFLILSEFNRNWPQFY